MKEICAELFQIAPARPRAPQSAPERRKGVPKRPKAFQNYCGPVPSGGVADRIDHFEMPQQESNCHVLGFIISMVMMRLRMAWCAMLSWWILIHSLSWIIELWMLT